MCLAYDIVRKYQSLPNMRLKMQILVTGGLRNLPWGITYGNRNRSIPDREQICNSIIAIGERLLSAFPPYFRKCVNQGGQITKQHIERYLRLHRNHYIELINQALTWPPGGRIASVGMAYGVAMVL